MCYEGMWQSSLHLKLLKMVSDPSGFCNGSFHCLALVLMMMLTITITVTQHPFRGRVQAIHAIQSLIDHIKVTPTNTGFDVELHGELGAIMEMLDQNERRPAGTTAGRSFSVVAGG